MAGLLTLQKEDGKWNLKAILFITAIIIVGGSVLIGFIVVAWKLYQKRLTRSEISSVTSEVFGDL